MTFNYLLPGDERGNINYTIETISCEDLKKLFSFNLEVCTGLLWLS